ncbi:MAG: 5-methylcytosine restriction system specificity protein McrC [Myxococcota bacterium]
MAVPVQNIYYLLCYAWDRLEARDLVDVGAVPGNRTENLLAKVLVDGVAHLVRRGLDRGYVPFEEQGRRVRGKLLLTETARRMLVQQGRAACQVDELSHDVPHNRVLKAAMRALMGLPELDRGLRGRLRDHSRRLHEVADVELGPAAFRSVQLHRNVARYAFLMNVCRLIEQSFLPDPQTGRRRFHPFTANEQQMGLLFEAFVRNFLRREQRELEVTAAKVPWSRAPLGDSDPAWLPEMQTDVLLADAERRVVIEAKFYAQPYQLRHGTPKLRSTNLYQLLTYLSHLRAGGGPPPVGVLLYASTGQSMRVQYRLDGHPVLVRTLDLDRDWQAIHRDLLALTQELRLSEWGGPPLN